MISCGTVVFFQKSRNLSRSLLTNNNFYCVCALLHSWCVLYFFLLFCYACLSKKSCNCTIGRAKNQSNIPKSILKSVPPSVQIFYFSLGDVDFWDQKDWKERYKCFWNLNGFGLKLQRIIDYSYLLSLCFWWCLWPIFYLPAFFAATQNM